MPEATLLTLLTTALVIGLTHTLAGPDHYVPFIAMAKVGGWSRRKTIAVTLWCGLAHVGSSVAIGLVGIALGVAVGHLDWLESFRGGLAGWLLLGFGLAYTVWGIRQAIRNRPHAHVHTHIDGTVHRHVHTHHDEHVHVHTHDAGPPAVPAHHHPNPDRQGGVLSAQRGDCHSMPHRTPEPLPSGRGSDSGDAHAGSYAHGAAHGAHAGATVVAGAASPTSARGRMTPWVLFTIFVFGPCEPLIPLLMVPAAGLHWGAVALVTLVFSAATIAVMLGLVLAGVAGLSLLPMERMERYTHALAGGALLACGLAIQFGL